MEALDHDYGEADNVQIGAVMTIVEVQRLEGDQVQSDVRMRFDQASGDPYRIIGLLRAAEAQVLGFFGGQPG
jgi:hypothetical protein